MNTEHLENSSPLSILPVDTGAGAGAIAGLVVGYVLSLRIRRKIQNNARFEERQRTIGLHNNSILRWFIFLAIWSVSLSIYKPQRVLIYLIAHAQQHATDAVV